MPRLWSQAIAEPDLPRLIANTAAEYVGVDLVAIGDDWLEGTLSLDANNCDLDGTLHPGVLGILAEALGSVAANLCVDGSKQRCVGQTLSVNHPVAIAAGPVRARATQVSNLKLRQVWRIDVRDPDGVLIAVAFLTAIVVNEPHPRWRA